MNQEFPDVQAGIRKSRGTRNRIANIHWIIEKARQSPKPSTSAALTIVKPLIVWITTDCETLLKRWEHQTTLPTPWETFTEDNKKQLELDMEQQTGSKLGKTYMKAGYCAPAHLTYMQRTSYEMLGWMTHKLESRLSGEISTTSDMEMMPLFGRKWRGTK